MEVRRNSGVTSVCLMMMMMMMMMMMIIIIITYDIKKLRETLFSLVRFTIEEIKYSQHSQYMLYL